MFALPFLACLVAWASDAAAQQNGGAAPATNAAPNAVPCDAFRKNPDGSWTALRDASVSVGTWRVSAAANTKYGPHAISVNGVDFTEYLDSHCAAGK